MEKNLIITAHDVTDIALKNGVKLNSGLYFDKPRDAVVGDNTFGGLVTAENKRYNSMVIVAPGSSRWEQSPAYDKLWTEIETKMNSLKTKLDTRKFNASQFPAEYYDLINMFRLDLTRRRVEAGDMSGMIAKEIVNPNISRTASYDEFAPFAGAFEEIKGRGDKPPMMEHATGSTGTIKQKLYALGDARTLEDALYNSDIYSTMKVMEAYARAHGALRNDLTFGAMVDATFSSKQLVSHATTSGYHADELLYTDINAGVEALRAMIDPQTKLPIDASRISLVCPYGSERKINRVINGQLDNAKGKAANYSAINEVVEIIPYRGDVITVGNRKYTYNGCPTGYIFMFVSGANNAPNYVVTKRALTYETGRGDLFSLVREGQVGYFSQAEFNTEFLGGTERGLADGEGYVVKVAIA